MQCKPWWNIFIVWVEKLDRLKNTWIGMGLSLKNSKKKKKPHLSKALGYGEKAVATYYDDAKAF